MLPKIKGSEACLISIIIPCYNEEQSIAIVIESLLKLDLLYELEIIVVDDCSIDRTYEISSTYNDVKTVKHGKNRGYGASIVTGIRQARGQYIAWFDGDSQHKAEDLQRLLYTITESELDYCIGARDENSYSESSRKIGKYILSLVVRIASGSNAGDFNSGMRIFKSTVIKRYLHLLPQRFGASTTTTILMLERGYDGVQVPISVKKRLGESSVRQIHDGFGTIMLILKIVLLFKPLSFFGLVGGVCITLGVSYGFIEAILFGLGFPVLSSILITLGIQTVFTGLLCDQVSAMRREKFEN